jgi:hypothetical protein
LLMSTDFIASEWSMYELGHAITAFRNTEALLIPVVIKKVDIPAFLKKIQYILMAHLCHPKK